MIANLLSAMVLCYTCGRILSITIFLPMKQTLLSFAFLSLALGTAEVCAQNSIVAGQTAGLSYRVLQPRMEIEAQGGGYQGGAPVTTVYKRDSLDIDNDGLFDITFLVSSGASGGKYQQLMSQVAAGHPHVEFLKGKSTRGIGDRSSIVALEAGQVITDTTAPFIDDFSSTQVPTWVSTIQGKTLQPMFAFTLSSPIGAMPDGNWLDGLPHYAGFRLRAGAGWRYGWLKVQTKYANILYVLEYALQPAGTLAATSSATSLAGLFPNPTHGLLHIPGSLQGSLTILDAVGKTVFSQEVPAGSEPTLSLDMLPTGSYFLEVRAADGFIRRGRFEKI